MSLRTEYQGKYVKYYDAIYQDRDIVGSCRQLVELLSSEQHTSQPYCLLDFGCGTGSHAMLLARQGWEIVGLDLSSEMIHIANSKKQEGCGKTTFICGDAALLKQKFGPEYFHGMISLFNVFNCMSSAEEMLATLKELYELIIPAGRSVIELWNGAAVLNDQPQVKTKQLPCPDDPAREITQTLTPTLKKLSQRILLDYHITLHDKELGQIEEARETHIIHYLTPVHYRMLFDQAGFEVCKEFPTGRPDEQLSIDNWFVTYLLTRR